MYTMVPSKAGYRKYSDCVKTFEKQKLCTILTKISTFYFEKMKHVDYKKIHSTLRKRATNPPNPNPCSRHTGRQVKPG